MSPRSNCGKNRALVQVLVKLRNELEIEYDPVVAGNEAEIRGRWRTFPGLIWLLCKESCHRNTESEQANGTSVQIVLPARIEMGHILKLVEPLDHPLRILVAEDEPLVKEVILLYLREDGHMVDTAENGVEALNRFEAGEYDIVVTDHSMPEMNGDQLAVAIKERDPKTVVVLLTGFGNLMEETGEQSPGVDVTIGKPFTFATLRTAIAQGMKRTN